MTLPEHSPSSAPTYDSQSPDQQPMAQPRAWPEVPGVRIVGIVGHGGFATVYEGVQLSMNRPVAVKVDSRSLDDERNRRRYMREVSATSRISSHPHVISLIDTGVLRDGRPFIVMELCPGGSLADLVERGPMPAPDAVALVEAAASALGAGHAAGILHRDVKPGNILLDAFGAPRLTDFGIASVAREGQDPTVTLECLTPDFAAPEAFAMAVPAPQGDVWSMGAVLYTMLTGHSPRRHTTGRSLSLPEIVEGLKNPIDLGDPRVPALLTPLLTQALDPDPARRHADGTALARALVRAREALGDGALTVAGPRAALLQANRPREDSRGWPAPSPAPVGPRQALSGGASSAPSAHPSGSPLAAPPTTDPSTGRPAHPRRGRRLAAAAAVLAVGAGLGAGGAWIIAERGSGATTAISRSSPGPGTSQQAGQEVNQDGRRAGAAAQDGASGTAGATGSSGAPVPSASEPPHPEGSCLAGITSISGQSSAKAVDCSQSHSWRVFAVGTLAPSTASGSDDSLVADAEVLATCTTAAAEASGYAEADAALTVLGPSEAAWQAGKRGFSCLVATG
ncbi:Serine/threonine protein kinase [Actinomyces denticolens]|uniref:non-specific serine/threonine protein kinase n=1 Tax=Actinomyces denticolens TaxID=52767 RepID=A0ABY1IDA6_9ACTO|nr:serine/threonine-protein kinase [Actinomyces denticolens]SHJ00575.1 Serine/threonine protein kinase [Actinomyces denticolens]